MSPSVARGGATLASPDAVAARVAALSQPHMAALQAYRETLLDRGPVPHFDPFDGGVDARILLLLETPGPGASPIRFTSLDNPSPTAANLRRFIAASGPDRRALVIWNIVPWILSVDRVKAPSASDMADGLKRMPALLALLPALGIVLLAGRRAASATAPIAAQQSRLPILHMPHPSPTHINTRPELAARFVARLSQAQAFLDPPPATPGSTSDEAGVMSEARREGCTASALTPKVSFPE